jgi:hypothetical protein
MITIEFNKKQYSINKEKLVIVLEKLSGEPVSENDILKLMDKYCLFDEYFLTHVNEL